MEKSSNFDIDSHKDNKNDDLKDEFSDTHSRSNARPITPDKPSEKSHSLFNNENPDMYVPVISGNSRVIFLYKILF